MENFDSEKSPYTNAAAEFRKLLASDANNASDDEFDELIAISLNSRPSKPTPKATRKKKSEAQTPLATSVPTVSGSSSTKVAKLDNFKLSTVKNQSSSVVKTRNVAKKSPAKKPAMKRRANGNSYVWAPTRRQAAQLIQNEMMVNTPTKSKVSKKAKTMPKQTRGKNKAPRTATQTSVQPFGLYGVPSASLTPAKILTPDPTSCVNEISNVRFIRQETLVTAIKTKWEKLAVVARTGDGSFETALEELVNCCLEASSQNSTFNDTLPSHSYTPDPPVPSDSPVVSNSPVASFTPPIASNNATVSSVLPIDFNVPIPSSMCDTLSTSISSFGPLRSGRGRGRGRPRVQPRRGRPRVQPSARISHSNLNSPLPNSTTTRKSTRNQRGIVEVIDLAGCDVDPSPQVRVLRSRKLQKAAQVTLPVEEIAASDTNCEYTINVWWKSKEFKRFTIRKYQNFRSIYEHYVSVANVPKSQLLFTHDGKIINEDTTPESLLVASNTALIEGGIVDPSLVQTVPSTNDSYNGNKSLEKDSVEFKIQMAHLKKPLIISMKRSDKMIVLMEKVAESISINCNRLAFNFDGERVDAGKTAIELDFDGGECFDVFVAQRITL